MLQELLKGRGAVIELLAAAFLMALGVNFLALGIASVSGFDPWAHALTGLALTFVALLILTRKILAHRHVERIFDGLFVYDKKNSRLVRIHRYRLSDALSDYLTSLFAENEATKKLWESDPLSKQFETDAETGKIHHRLTESTRLIREAIEYFALDHLSTHLTDYFNKPTFKATRLMTLGREDIPSVLFRNRFLDTFSRPMAERPAFVDQVIKKKASAGEVVAAVGPEARYERFDLVLPAKASVARTADNRTKISTPKFNLTIESVYDGFNGTLPEQFEKRYLGLDSHLQHTELDSHFGHTVYIVKVRVSVTFRMTAMFTKVGWDYHMWLDSFLESLERDFSIDLFLQRIAWEQTATILSLLDSRREGKSVGSAKNSGDTE